MKCFHFPAAPEGPGSSPPPRVPWSRSLSLASGAPHEELGRRRGRGDDGLRAFEYAELKAATRGFGRAQVIGEGGFGCVYRGAVKEPEGEVVHVAVKKLEQHSLQFTGVQGVDHGGELLSVLDHPNLVKLIGFCAEEDERGIQRLLVYELMPNKSLEDQLFRRIQSPLSWAMRLRIAQDAARGLAYLHEEMDFQIIFRDFKSANILLDENFNAKLSDFGLAREGPAEGLGHILTSVVGTMGYAAPEYVHSGRLTAKSDVWSYGVVLFELVTGRRSIDSNLPRREQKLLDWVKPYAADPKRLHFIMDRRLEGRYCLKSAHKVVALANKCLTRLPKCRPKMSEVVETLGEIIELCDDLKVNEREQSAKEEVRSRCKVLDLKEFISLRNRSTGRLDWRTLTPGLMRTWG